MKNYVICSYNIGIRKLKFYLYVFISCASFFHIKSENKNICHNIFLNIILDIQGNKNNETAIPLKLN
jgi:hypothetical protein